MRRISKMLAVGPEKTIPERGEVRRKVMKYEI
jgi:hypothetical protein